jgi:hypothetical protein
MPLRPGDQVVFVGPGPDPTLESEVRHEPEGEPRPADHGEVIAAEGGLVTVAWRFGATTLVRVGQLYKQNANGPIHRYNVTFENVERIEDALYVVVTGGGAGKAVWLASRALSEERPRFWPVVVDVEDLGEVLVDYRNQEIPSELHDPLEWM